MVSREAKIDRLERELHRIRISPSLRLGSIITDAIRKPWKAPFLLFTLPWNMFLIGLEMLGKKSPPAALVRVTQDPTLSERNCAIMFPTNGVGFGHFTRMLALAKYMKKQDPELEVIFFTTMSALHLLKPYEIPAHHISGSPYFEDMTTEEWNALLEEELSVCIEAHRPKQFIFDGAFPYRGMLRTLKARPHIDKIWMRRGTFRRGKSIPVDSVEHFDLIIHPGDSIPRQPSEIEHDVPSISCQPITLLESSELMSRKQARLRLEVPIDAVVVYVQLGAGEINDIDSEVRLTIESLISRENVHVVLGESMIGSRFEFDLPRVHILRDYPNSLYFNAFDLTIQAGGYNSFHEVRRFGIPTLFYPNLLTGMDDQLARCKVAEKEGWGYVLEKRDANSIDLAISNLLNKVGERKPLEGNSGAIEVAENLISRIK